MVVVGESAVGGRAHLQSVQGSFGVCDDGIAYEPLEGGLNPLAGRGETETVVVEGSRLDT